LTTGVNVQSAHSKEVPLIFVLSRLNPWCVSGAKLISTEIVSRPHYCSSILVHCQLCFTVLFVVFTTS